MENREMRVLNHAELAEVAGGVITQEQALEKALAYVGLKRNQIDYLKYIDIDYEYGRKVYEIRFYRNGLEYEFDIDVENGNIIKFDKDWDD